MVAKKKSKTNNHLMYNLSHFPSFEKFHIFDTWGPLREKEWKLRKFSS